MNSQLARSGTGSGQPAGTAAPPPPPPPVTTSRRDAVRNHQRILDAAREVFGESGADASIEEIAARAGVGVGTVYRRCTSKDGLIDELLRLVLEDAADLAHVVPPARH